MLVGLIPFGGPEEKAIPRLSSAFCGWLAILGIPWLTAESVQPLPLSLHGWPSTRDDFIFSPSCKDTTHWLWAPPP